MARNILQAKTTERDQWTPIHKQFFLGPAMFSESQTEELCLILKAVPSGGCIFLAAYVIENVSIQKSITIIQFSVISCEA